MIILILQCLVIIHILYDTTDFMRWQVIDGNVNNVGYMKIKLPPIPEHVPISESQGSCWRVIRAKKSPCEGWLYFLVGQKRSSSHLVILKSRPHISSTCHLWKCRYCARVYWNLLYPLLSILNVIFLESNPLRFIETLISFIRAFVYCLYMPGLKENYLYFFFVKIQWRHFGKGMQYATVLREMLTKLFVCSYFQQNKLLIDFFSFLWHKIIVLISNMFIYVKIAIQNSLKMKCT